MKKLFQLIPLLCLLFSACKKNDLSSPATSENETSQKVTDPRYLMLMKKLGIDTSHVIDRGKFVVAEGDIGIAKTFLDTLQLQTIMTTNERLKHVSNGQNANARLAHTHNLLTNNNVSINVPNQNSIIYDASYRAISEWNALANCNLNIYRHTNGADPYDWKIIIDNTIGDYAWSDMPGYPDLNGRPGLNILVNESQMVAHNLTWYNCARILMHEIGHMSGLRHQNWEQWVDDAEPWGAEYIPNAPNSDPASVFVKEVGFPQNLALYPWPEFSAADINALETLYPRNICNLQGFVNLPVSTPVNVVRGNVYEFSYPSLFEQITWIDVEITGVGNSYSHPPYNGPVPEDGYRFPSDLQPNQTYKFKMRYTNAKGCTSTWGEKTVTLTN